MTMTGNDKMIAAYREWVRPLRLWSTLKLARNFSLENWIEKNLYAEKANWKVVERGGEYVIYPLYGESERVSTT